MFSYIQRHESLFLHHGAFDCRMACCRCIYCVCVCHVFVVITRYYNLFLDGRMACVCIVACVCIRLILFRVQDSEKKLCHVYKQVLYGKMHDAALRYAAKIKKTPEEVLAYSSIKEAIDEYKAAVATEQQAIQEEISKRQQASSANASSSKSDGGGTDAADIKGSAAPMLPEPDSQGWWHAQADTFLNECVKLLVDPGSETALMTMIQVPHVAINMHVSAL